MADKKKFSNTKSIVKVETGIVTLISYHHYLKIVGNNKLSGMSLEADNRRKSPVTLAVTASYFFSLKKIMRENLSSIGNTTYSACIYWSETTHIVNGTCYNHMLTFLGLLSKFWRFDIVFFNNRKCWYDL